MTLTPMGLAVLIAIMLPGLERALTRVVMVLGPLTAAGLVLMWLLSFGEGGIRPGSGMVVTGAWSSDHLPVVGQLRTGGPSTDVPAAPSRPWPQ